MQWGWTGQTSGSVDRKERRRLRVKEKYLQALTSAPLLFLAQQEMQEGLGWWRFARLELVGRPDTR